MKVRFFGKGNIAVFDIVNGLLLLLFTLLVVYPFYQCVIISFNNGTDIDMNGVIYLYPRVFSLDSYQTVLSDPRFLIGARNTVLRTLLAAPLCVLITAMYAYGVSHAKLVLRKLFTTLGLVSMYFSGGLIPTFLLVRDIGLYDSFGVYLLIFGFNMFYALVFVAYFKGIPKSIEECSIIDGANEVVIFFRIMMPIAMPVFAAILLFAAVLQWNTWFDCMIYTDDENLVVMSFIFAKLLLAQTYLKQVALQNDTMTPEEILALRGPVTSMTLQMATMVLATGPIIAIYPFLQKYFVKGIMVGSLKG